MSVILAQNLFHLFSQSQNHFLQLNLTAKNVKSLSEPRDGQQNCANALVITSRLGFLVTAGGAAVTLLSLSSSSSLSFSLFYSSNSIKQKQKHS